MNADLHLFILMECDYVAAADIGDAWRRYAAETGLTRDDLDDPSDPGDAVPDEKEIGCWCDEHGEPDEHGAGTDITKTAREWAVQCGPGLVFTTEGP